MFRARTRATVEYLAREARLRFIGWSIYGDWYAGASRDELARVGCTEVIELPL